MMVHTLAWIPFLEPMPSIGAWWPIFLIPLSIGISMIYKALRLPTLRNYAMGVAVMSFQIILAMAVLAVALFLVVQFLIPTIPAD